MLASSTTLVPAHRRYVELLAHSHFSFLQGASSPEDLVLRAQDLGYDGMALCDLNGLYGVVRAFQAIEYPSQFLVPRESTYLPFRFHCGAEMQFLHEQASVSIALLPINKFGYFNLCQLITESKRQSPKGYSNLSLDILEKFNQDLMALVPPPWPPSSLLRLSEIFAQRLHLAVYKDFSWQSQEFYNQALHLEREHGFSLFATQRPVMATAENKPLHDVLTCILHGTTLEKSKTLRLSNADRHLKPLDQLDKLWADRPDLLAKTVAISDQLHFSLKELQYEYPEAARPPGQDATQYLRKLTEEGLKRRFPSGVTEKVMKQVESELQLIEELRYEDYFLTLWDVCQYATRQGILHQGRGSAANSVVCYALGLTSVDPTRIQLLFERFISRERGEPPDIDIDFESSRREEVIQYIYQKYGADHAAMVCTVICYRSRMALRDCAKVLGIPLQTINAMVRFMGREGLSRLKASPEKAKEWGMTPQKYELLVKLAYGLKGFPRHLGIHTGGFLIAKRLITECVPVEKATMDQRYVIQWNKDDLNVLKMLKIDVLGLGMLSALQKSFALLKSHHNIDMELHSVPEEDKATYAMISQADTVGTFQIESRAQMSLLPRLKPKTFYDIVIEVAIVRPGPIQGGMIHPFLKRRHGQEAVTYPHPDLQPILERTSGVPIFQEQIMQMASTVAGFTPGEADELRRIMSSSWKKQELMSGLRQRLLNGMIQHGISMQYAEQIYQTIVGFASYGFPESHAASFALITYASCYIKCHYPHIFVCSLLNAQPMGFYSPRALIQDAQRHGVEFLPLDIQKSELDYTLEGQKVRVGFCAIFGFKTYWAEALVKERVANGPFQSLQSLIERTSIPKSALMQLAAAGALQTLGLNARDGLWTIQSLDFDNRSLFFAKPKNHPADQHLLPKESEWQAMVREYQSLGYALYNHPLKVLRPGLKLNQKPPFCMAHDLGKRKNGETVRVAGLLSLQQKPPTAKGFAFLTLEDESGFFNIVLTPDIYERFRLIVASQPLLEITGRLEKVEGVLNIKARHIHPLLVEDLLTPTA